MTEAVDRRIPVTVLGGFLGSGKTTLLRHVLRDERFGDSAVLINEFGAASIDGMLVGAVAGEPVLLASGCVCCTIRGDLAGAIRDLHARRGSGVVPPFRRLFIELTGLADPAPVVATVLADRVVRHHFRPGPVVTTADVPNGRAALSRHDVARRQVAAADLLVVTKTDLRPDADAEALRAVLRSLNPIAALADALHGALDPALVGSDASSRIAASDADVGSAGNVRQAHDATVRSLVLEADMPIPWTSFGLWFSLMAHRHGTSLLRMKGVLCVSDSDTPVAVQTVGPVVHPPEHLPAWPSDARASRLVLITDGLDPIAIERSFRAFCGLDRQ